MGSTFIHQIIYYLKIYFLQLIIYLINLCKWNSNFPIFQLIILIWNCNFNDFQFTFNYIIIWVPKPMQLILSFYM